MKQTVTALMARGIGQKAAEVLAARGITLSALQQMDKSRLLQEGLSIEVAEKILNGARPAIPSATVAGVLFRNRYQCCVCRDPEKSIILHHIKHWAESRSHEESNIAVLCLEHHAQAHRISSLAQNLESRTPFQLKKEWEAVCARFDAEAILKASAVQHSAWLYFNHQRLFALAADLGVDLLAVAGFGSASTKGLVDAEGVPQTQRGGPYLYKGGDGLTLYGYVRNVLHSVMKRLTVVNISDFLDQGQLNFFVTPGDFIFVQGAHTFKKLNSQDSDPGQLSSGERRAHGVSIQFAFDRWEATSTSAWGLWLLGRQRAGCFLHVKNTERKDRHVIIQGTVLSISNGLADLKTRDYSPDIGQFMARRYAHWIEEDEGSLEL